MSPISTPPRQEPPSRGVLAAFGAEGPARQLPGGRGGTWCADGIVLKQAGLRTETAWRANTLNTLPPSDEFRVAPPVRSMDGTWTAGGWEAWRLVPGTADERRVDDVLRVGRAFHAALAELPRPAFLDERDDPWSRADRFSWGHAEGADPAEAAEEAVPAREFDLVAPLLAARTPLPDEAAQAVHGDLLGNVLFADADGLPPAIIDWSPYWRPPGWACAVAAVDALSLHGADPGVLDRWAHVPHWRQLLVRALLFRIAAHDRLDRELETAYRPVVDLVLDGHWPQVAEPRPEPRTRPRPEPAPETRTRPRTDARAEQPLAGRAGRRTEPLGLRSVPQPQPSPAEAQPTPEPAPAQPQPAPAEPGNPSSDARPEAEAGPQRAEHRQEMLDVPATGADARPEPAAGQPAPESHPGEPGPETASGQHAEPHNTELWQTDPRRPSPS